MVYLCAAVRRSDEAIDNEDETEVSAKMKDGILAIYIPKVEEVKPEVKKIAIK